MILNPVILQHATVICISGPTSSGKTVLANFLAESIPVGLHQTLGIKNIPVEVISQDDFPLPQDLMNVVPINFNIDNLIENDNIENNPYFIPMVEDDTPWNWFEFYDYVEKQYIDGIEQNLKLRKLQYNQQQPTSQKILVLEGTTIFSRPAIFDYCDLKYDIKTPKNISKKRRLNRIYKDFNHIPKFNDIVTSSEYFENIIWPEYVKYIENSHSRAKYFSYDGKDFESIFAVDVADLQLKIISDLSEFIEEHPFQTEEKRWIREVYPNTCPTNNVFINDCL